MSPDALPTSSPAARPSDSELPPILHEVGTIRELISRMEALDAPLREQRDEKRYFHGTYLRNTRALLVAWEGGSFVDKPWFQRWDVVFGGMYLDCLERFLRGETLSSPWQSAFEIARDPALPPLRHLLVLLCVHLNYDLPRALLKVMTDEDFDTPAKLASRQIDYAKIDDVLTSRVTEEDRALIAEEEPGDRPFLAFLLTPFNRLGVRRFLLEVRRKIWRNAQLLSQARQQGPEALAARVAQLDTLTRAKLREILEPGQVLLRLALHGYGVTLPEPCDALPSR